MKKNIEMKKKSYHTFANKKKIEHKINVKWKLTLRCHNILNVLIHSMQPYKIGNKKREKKNESKFKYSNTQIQCHGHNAYNNNRQRFVHLLRC